MVKRKNPGSDVDIETDSANCFKFFYMCLAASKHGWPYCRPVIVVDGSALKAKFGGMLLAACGHDANGSIFPLAFGIVPSESNESWTWFFEKLRDSIGTRESLAIVADRHKGIEYAANLVYPDAAFGICVQHLAANLKTRYKDFKGPLKTYFDGAS
ncbi:transposase, partial [Streptomyces sp. S5]|uniref:transposase n=1 Tax=Streptomyces sp. S5 TaxID=1456735 RepID=UPI0013CEA24E